MRLQSLMSWGLICAVVLLCGTLPAQSGVHLWRITEIFSNADGTIQFVELTTCCGSAGGEIFVGNQQVRSASNPVPFVFPANLDMTTANKHLLLGTDGYKALAGAPAVDYTIPSNFFSVNGDTLSFAVYDTMIFAAGVLPTDGTRSLNKNEEDSTDTNFVALNSPTNLHERTGSVTVVSGPPGVPDGTGGTTPLKVASSTLDGSSLRLTYDPTSCANAANHHILYGQKSGLPTAPGGAFTLMGGVCSIGNTSPYDWVGTPTPDDGGRLIWFLMTATDPNGVEGSWGVDSLGHERVGPGSGGASVACATIKNVANACGHTP